VPDTDPLIATFGRLGEVQGRLERQLGADLEARCGLPHAWFSVLMRLARSDDGQLTMSELADAVTLTTGGMTRLVDRLEAAGFVERRRSATDRRVTFAAITAAGRRTLRTASAVHGANLREVFAGFSPRELAVLDRLLTRLGAGKL
jgi:DNA-binding MarR family transcriptional regulator